MTVLTETFLETNSSEIEIDIQIRPVPSIYPDYLPPKLVITAMAAMVAVLTTGLCCLILWIHLRSTGGRASDEDDDPEEFIHPIYRPSHTSNISSTAPVDYTPLYNSELMYPRLVEAQSYTHDIKEKPQPSGSSSPNTTQKHLHSIDEKSDGSLNSTHTLSTITEKELFSTESPYEVTKGVYKLAFKVGDDKQT